MTSPDRRYPTAAALLADIDAVLARIGLDPEVERPRLLADPTAYAEQAEPALATRYLELGTTTLAAGQTGRAIDDFDRVLSIDPNNRQVRRILDQRSCLWAKPQPAPHKWLRIKQMQFVAKSWTRGQVNIRQSPSTAAR